MSMSRVYLCLIFLTFLTSPPVLCSRSPRLAAPSAAIGKKLEKAHVHPPAMLVSESTKVDSPSSMTKIDDEPATSSAIAGFFRYRFPFQGWPFHKYAPFPMVNPANPSVPTTTPATGAEEEESEKVPSTPSKGNGDGGNA
ncbi:unnamed protein product [Thlaspi arvense]|uniref:Uncharacterized protein n=1 Tax=Thlaspi arvense TaxID=13288 RepID=A0AAU9T2M7_THLAR|nr:unnamed protein product [Thlaspi arvense]